MWHVLRPARCWPFTSKRVSHRTLTAHTIYWLFTFYTPTIAIAKRARTHRRIWIMNYQATARLRGWGIVGIIFTFIQLGKPSSRTVSIHLSFIRRAGGAQYSIFCTVWSRGHYRTMRLRVGTLMIPWSHDTFGPSRRTFKPKNPWKIRSAFWLYIQEENRFKH